MKGFNIAPPGSTGSLAPVAEFSTSLDNYDNQHEILSSTLSTLFTPNFMHKRQQSQAGSGSGGAESPTSPTQSGQGGTIQVTTNQVTTKYNKSALKPYNKRIAGHKKRWGTHASCSEQ